MDKAKLIEKLKSARVLVTDSHLSRAFPAYLSLDELDLILTSLTAPVDGKEEESIKCPYCNDGYTPEHTNHLPEEPCVECPIFVPCGYCYGSGRVTTKLMKEHIEFDKASKYLNDDGLPF